MLVMRWNARLCRLGQCMALAAMLVVLAPGCEDTSSSDVDSTEQESDATPLNAEQNDAGDVDATDESPEGPCSSQEWEVVREAARKYERVAETCLEAGVDPEEVTCVDYLTEDGYSQCSRASDCRWGGVCMRVGSDNSGECECQPAGCVSDADCSQDRACFCGTFGYNLDPNDDVDICYRFFDVCGSGCLASSCRSSADCPSGGLCIVDKGLCQASLIRPDLV